MKFTRKLLPALALLLVSAVLMTTATFAWFSMNTRVSATGMQMETEAGDNVLISANETKTLADLIAFQNALINNQKRDLRPVSSADGANFYYVKGFQVSGDGSTNAPTGYAPYALYNDSARSDFKNNYRIRSGEDAYGYIEYKFQVMATNASDVAKDLVFDAIDLTYSGSNDVPNAFRAAIFVDEFVADSNADDKLDVTTETLVTILRPSDAKYLSNPAGTGTNQAVVSTSEKGAVSNKLDARAVLAEDIPADATKFFRVVVRVWLEGEDTTCTNATFASLDETWSLDLSVAFSNTAVNKLNDAERSIVLNEANGYTVGAAYQVIDTTVYYPILLNGQPVEVAGASNAYLYTAATSAPAFASVSNFYSLTKETYNGYDTYHKPINVTPQYKVVAAVDLTAAEADTTVGEEIDGTSYYAITGKALDGKQLYATASGALSAASEVYTITANTATEVTDRCFLPADLTSATAADDASKVVIDPTPDDTTNDDAVTYYAITGKFLRGVQLYADAAGDITATSTIYTIAGGVATDVTACCTLPTATP